MRRFPDGGRQGRTLAILLVAGWAMLATGCGVGGGQDSGADGPLIIPAVDTSLPRATIQEGLEFYAMGQGRTVRLFLRNINHREVLVGPRCFGVIAPGARSVEPFLLGRDDHFLPVRVLREGESVQGFLRFNSQENLVGGSLVFVAPDDALPPIRCLIDADTGPGPGDEETRQ